jgi:hypothetical protein
MGVSMQGSSKIILPTQIKMPRLYRHQPGGRGRTFCTYTSPHKAFFCLVSEFTALSPNPRPTSYLSSPAT